MALGVWHGDGSTWRGEHGLFSCARLRHVSGFRSAQGFCFGLQGLGFRRVGPCILEAAQASEIGGVHAYRQSTDVLKSRLGRD